MALSVREATADEIANWDNLVDNYEGCRLFHKTAWLRSIEAFAGCKPLFLLFIKNNEIVGCFPGFVV